MPDLLLLKVIEHTIEMYVPTYAYNERSMAPIFVILVFRVTHEVKLKIIATYSDFVRSLFLICTTSVYFFFKKQRKIKLGTLRKD